MYQQKFQRSHYSPYSGFGDAAADAAMVTVDARGVKTIVPAAGIALMSALAGKGAVVLTTAADKEQVILAGDANPGLLNAADWVNAQLARGRSVMISTNDPKGFVSLLAPSMTSGVGTQIVLAAVSTPADEVAGAGATMPSSALIAPSKLGLMRFPGGIAVPQKAGLGGPVAVAVVALLVVGGVYYAFGRKKKSSR